jgi:hypothetical protein
MAAIASLQVNALFGKKAPAKAAPAKKATLKKAAPVKKSAPVKKTVTKKAPARKAAGAGRKGNIGPNRTLWNGWDSKAEAPAYLDGTLPGDAGFDPAGLSKPVEYLQFGLDSLDQNGVINASGNVIGKLKKVDNKPTERTIVVRLRRGDRINREPDFTPSPVFPEILARVTTRACAVHVWRSLQSRTEGSERTSPGVTGSTPVGGRAGTATRSRFRCFSSADFLQLSRGQNPSRFFFRGCIQRASSTAWPEFSLRFPTTDCVPPLTSQQPFNEAFDIVRFRECELQHSRWAMLGLVGVIAAEKSTGISWADAGKVLNEQPSYLGFDINVPLKSLVLIEVLAMGFAEVKRSSELDSNKRSYPGGYFDPLNFAGKTTSPEALFKLKTAELKHGRLAMVGMLGVAAQATKNGEGALEALFGQ